MSDQAACDAESCNQKPDPRCPHCRGTGRVGAPLKVIVAGSRTVKAFWAVRDAIAAAGFEIGELVSGGASGPDKTGEVWAMERGIPVRRFPAEWRHGPKAGPMRNRQMAVYADALIAIWDGASRGTANMIEEMQQQGKSVFVHRVNP